MFKLFLIVFNFTIATTEGIESVNCDANAIIQSATPTTITQGEVIYLIGSNSTCSDGSKISFHWREVLNFSIPPLSELSSFTAKPTQSQWYYLTIYCGDNPRCMDTDSILITVLPAQCDTAKAVITGKSLICIGDEIELDGSASSCLTGNAPLITWLHNGASTPIIKVRPEITTTYQLLARCGSDGCADTAEFTVEVINCCSGTQANISGDSSVCENSPAYLDASASTCPEGKTIDYLWSTGSTERFIWVNPTQKTSYWVRVQCSQEALCVDYDTFTVNVEPLPEVTANAGEDKTIRKGESIYLDASNSFCEDITLFEWHQGSANGALISRDRQVFVTPIETTTYTLVVSCGQGECVARDTDAVVITISNNNDCQPAIINLVALTKTHVCQGDEVILDAGSSYCPLAEPMHFLWSTGSTNTQIKFTPEISQWVWIQITCGPEDCIAKDSIWIEVVMPPQVNVVIDTVLIGEITTFHGLDANVTYQWDFDNNNEIDAVGNTVTYQFGAVGEFPVRVLVQNTTGCQNEAIVIAVVKEDNVQLPCGEPSLMVNPNPVAFVQGELVDIRIHACKPVTNAVLKIMDRNGLIIRELAFNSVNQEINILWDGLDNNGRELPMGPVIWQLEMSDNPIYNGIIMVIR